MSFDAIQDGDDLLPSLVPNTNDPTTFSNGYSAASVEARKSRRKKEVCDEGSTAFLRFS